MNDTQIRDELAEEAARLGVDVLYSEKGHFAAARPWRHAHVILGCVSALLAVVAGASFVSTWFQPWVPPLFAFLSALLTGLTTFLKPDEAGKQHHESGVKYGHIRRQLRQFAKVSVHIENVSTDQLQQTLAELTDRINSVQIESRAIPAKAHAAAYQSIKNGSADYTTDEMRVALGDRK